MNDDTITIVLPSPEIGVGIGGERPKGFLIVLRASNVEISRVVYLHRSHLDLFLIRSAEGVDGRREFLLGQLGISYMLNPTLHQEEFTVTKIGEGHETDS